MTTDERTPREHDKEAAETAVELAKQHQHGTWERVIRDSSQHSVRWDTPRRRESREATSA